MIKISKGRKANMVIADTAEYRITTIPLNYMIECKVEVAGTGKFKGKMIKLIGAPFYSPIERGESYAHETAKYIIERHLKEASVSPVN